MNRVAYLFAGQGAQYIGMGKDLYESFPQAKAVFEQADEVLDFSLSRLCFQGPQEELRKTQNCQPAVLTASIAALEALKAASGSKLQAPSYAAGLSLGEYSALVASGAISFADAVYLVRRRGEFMEEEAAKLAGGMLSIIGLAKEQLQRICAQSNTEIANLNSPGQIVISGEKKGLSEAEKLAKEAGANLVVSLQVSGAFHSSLMRPAALRLAKELEKIKINPLGIPVISNVSARAISSLDEIKDNLIKQVYSAVLWEDSMKFIISGGIRNFFEFGPGKVLKGLMRRIEPQAQVESVEKKEDIVGLVTSRE
jgi:[acyl-carrier-protein] S-malonyltransferase